MNGRSNERNMRAGLAGLCGLLGCIPIVCMAGLLVWADVHAEEISELDRHGMIRTKEILGKLKLKKFVPEDCAGEIVWYGRKVAVMYQRRLEFYNLPDGVSCYCWNSINVQPVAENALVMHGKPVFRKAGKELSLRPFKVVIFSTRLQSMWSWGGGGAIERGIFRSMQ